MQNITREAMSSALVSGAVDVDICNFFPACASLLYPDAELLAVRKYIKNAPLWRRAVAGYYDIPIVQAKAVLLCALYGYLTPRDEITESPHTPPCCRLDRSRHGYIKK